MGAFVRTLVIAACAGVVLGGVVWAQGPGGGGPGGDMGPPGGDFPDDAMEVQLPYIYSVDHDLKQLNKSLALTADQQTQVKEILEERNDKIQNLVKDYKDALRVISAASRRSPARTAGFQRE